MAWLILLPLAVESLSKIGCPMNDASTFERGFSFHLLLHYCWCHYYYHYLHACITNHYKNIKHIDTNTFICSEIIKPRPSDVFDFGEDCCESLNSVIQLGGFAFPSSHPICAKCFTSVGNPICISLSSSSSAKLLSFIIQWNFPALLKGYWNVYMMKVYRKFGKCIWVL